MIEALSYHPGAQKQPPGDQESYPGHEPGNATRAVENAAVCDRSQGLGEGGVVGVGGHPSHYSYQGGECRNDKEHACDGG